MIRNFGLIGYLGVLVGLARPVYAQIPQLRIQSDQFDLRLTAGAAVQVAVSDEVIDTAAVTGQEFELFARLDAIWTLQADAELGVKIEFANKNRASEVFDTGEIYGFVASKFGRLEVGEQDGPADTLSFAAPVIALGQIRGDFSRYAGSQALLKPLDSRDSFKLIYLSPEAFGLRAGISWSPQFRQNSGAIDPSDRVLIKDAIELGVQLEQKVGDWRLGLSGGYVLGKADAATTRADLDSWSVGASVRRGPLRVGAAYVRRGDSNRLERGFNQSELNGGVSWIEDRWGLSGSSAVTTANDRSNVLFGLGGFFELTSNLQLRSDLVRFREEQVSQITSKGLVGILEIQLKI